MILCVEFLWIEFFLLCVFVVGVYEFFVVGYVSFGFGFVGILSDFVLVLGVGGVNIDVKG